MRKILTSVLSVAGLLALTLALATSPASADRSVVQVDTVGDQLEDQAIAGAYTLSWETSGGCDPGANTSGSSGSITITVIADNEVANPNAPVVNELLGDTERDFVTVNDDCFYKWSGGFVDAATNAQCEVTGIPDPDADDAGENDTPATIPMSIEAVTDCAPGGAIIVTVTDGSFRAGAQTAGADTADDPLDDEYADDTDDGVTGGAISKTIFTVSAVPVPNSKVVCQVVAAESEVSAAGQNIARLYVVGDDAVVDGELTPVNCLYNVEVQLPDGFDAYTPSSNKARNQTAVDNTDTADVAENAVAPTVQVAVRSVFLIQTVVGDSNGGVASYSLGWPPSDGPNADPRCTPGLPPDLRRQIGITDETLVELREGTFNINAAITTNSSAGIDANALDPKGVQCYAGTRVWNLPDHCEAENPTNRASSNLATDADGDGNVRVDMVITCSEPMDEPETVDEPEVVDEPDDMDMDEPDDMDEPEVVDVPEGPMVDVPTG